MIRQMRLNLALGLCKKSQIPAIPRTPGSQAQQQCSSVPQGVQQTLPPPQCRDSRLGPREMLSLLKCRSIQLRSQAVISGRKRLPLVQGLCTNFADMIHTHQRSGVSPFLIAQRRFG